MGYLVAGVVGGVLATLAVFAPPFVIVIAGAPFYHRFARNPRVKAFVQGVTAAAVGAISGAVVVLGRRVELPPARKPTMRNASFVIPSMNTG